MISPALDSLIAPAARIHQLLWAVLTFSLVLYGVVAFLLARPEEARELPATLSVAFALAACAIAGVAFRIPAAMLRDEKLRAVLAPEPSPEALAKHPQTGQVDPDRRRRIAELPSNDQRLLRLPGAALTPFILRLAMHEAIGILGLVLSLLSHTFAPAVPFLLAAIALNWLARPRLRALSERGARLAY